MQDSSTRRAMNRAELHELVWSTSMVQLAKQFNCSDSWLAKLCRKARVPTPARGYWAKKAAGKRVRPRALPKNADPAEVVLWIHTGPPEPEPPPDDPDVAEALRRAESLLVDWPGEKRIRIHQLVKETRHAFGTAERVPLRLDVSRGTLKRSLRLFNLLLRAFEEVGCETVPFDEKGRTGGRYDGDMGSCTLVLGERFSFRVREALSMRRLSEDDPEARWRRVIYEPTGRLELELSVSPNGHYLSDVKKWRDRPKRGGLESRFLEIVLDTIRIAQVQRRKREESERREAAAAKARAAFELQRQEREAEARRVEVLRDAARRWRDAEALRRFVVAARMAAESDGNADAEHWLVWADGVAREMDPLAKGGLRSIRLAIEKAGQRRP